jgi:ribosomal protein L37E
MRDRAFILGLFGSGCRIGEFLPLRRKDVVFDEYGCHVLVDGKTGSRRVRLTPAASVALAAWLDVNPGKQPDAPVWINIQVRHVIPDRHLSYDWAHEMLRGLARRTGIGKPIRPHLLRHSLATYYAPRLTEAVMNEHFGWRQGGRTAAIYTHLSGKQVDDQILAAFGKKKIDPETNMAVDVVRCLRCGLENVPTSVQCGKCGFPLSDEAARKLLQRRQMADAILDRLTSRPEFVEAVGEMLTEESQESTGGTTRTSVSAGGIERGKRQGASLGS